MRQKPQESCEITIQPVVAGQLQITLSGSWILQASRPDIGEVKKRLASYDQVTLLSFDCDALVRWDSSFIAFLLQLREYCRLESLGFSSQGLPAGAQRLLNLVDSASSFAEARPEDSNSILTRLGLAVINASQNAFKWFEFSGEIIIAFSKMLVGKARFRLSDVFMFFQQAGPEAVPIVTLIGVLVGVILAFVGAIQLRLFGAELMVANLVGVGMTREMGAMMTAVIMAGRTGAAYAAQLGSMQVNEEVDAFRTMGIAPVEYLVLPRLLGLVIAMPLLYLYANVVGIAGGFLVGVVGLDLGIQEYLNQTASIIRLNDVLGGLVKSVLFGILIALAGCLRGMQCGRSSSAVGDAATSAVVAGITFMVIADAALTIIYDMFGV